jgi:hypothetical protein
MRWTGLVTQIREKRNWYKLLLGEAKGKRPLGRPRYKGWIILRRILDR